MKPSILLTGLFCLGILVQTYAPVPFSFLCWSIPVVFLTLIKPKWSAWGLGLVVFLLGIFHTAVFRLPLYDDVSWIDLKRFDNHVSVRGVVVTDPEEKRIKNYTKIVFHLKVQEIYLNDRWQEREGKILVNLFLKLKPQIGDILLLEGKLHYPYNFSEDTHFSYSGHLSNRGIKFILSVGKSGKADVTGRVPGDKVLKKIFQTRAQLADVFSRYLSPKESALMVALVLGQQEYIPKSLRQLFVETGTAHILAVSGFNVGVVAFVVFFILKMLFLPRTLQYVISMMVIIFYAVVTGGQAPVVRATIMGVIFLLSFLIDREADVLNSLSLSALILLVINPLTLFDISFQLSFLSVYFIVIIYPSVFEGMKKVFNLENHWLVDQMLQSLAISLAAFIGVSGLIVYYFGIVTPISILANVMVVPLSSLNIIFGLCLLLFHWICPVLAEPFAMCIHLCLNLTVVIACVLSQIPAAFFYLPKMSSWWTFGYYGVLVLILCGMKMKWVADRCSGKGGFILFAPAPTLNRKSRKEQSAAEKNKCGGG